MSAIPPGIPGHTSPPYSEEARDNALFHYTTARGLVGILSSGQVWSTAYHCANDETELAAGRGALTPLFINFTYKLIEARDPRVTTFAHRGVDIMTYADGFENLLTSMALGSLNTFITCFCKAMGPEDFSHGLLSQWRGYGADGGYAIQLNRDKLMAAVERIDGYDLQDVHYDINNPLREEMLRHSEAYIKAYEAHLNELAKPIDFRSRTMTNPIADLTGGPLEALLNYLVHTKNRHFGEERECRLSLVQATKRIEGSLPVAYYERGGLVIPYVSTPLAKLNILECIDWVLVGPGPRMASRFKSAVQLVQNSCERVYVRPSHIPFTRL